jgi:hypothetical protein
MAASLSSPATTLAEPRYPSVFALSVVFGGTIGLTAFSMLGLSGGAGFLIGFALSFGALASAVLVARARQETYVEADRLRELVFLSAQLSSSLADEVPSRMLELLHRQERSIRDPMLLRRIAQLDSTLEEARRLSLELHKYRVRPPEDLADRTAQWMAVSAAVITTLQLTMQLVRDLSEHRPE